MRFRPGPVRVLGPALLLSMTAVSCAAAGDLPADFARLSDIAPTVRQDMRYAGSNNFAGRPLAGYEAPVCILRREAAEALARVQAKLAAEKRTLVVYDCYRPVRAVTDILGWAKARRGPLHAPAFPAADRSRLVALGYIASRSLHSTGTAVDLGMAGIDQPVTPGITGAPCTAALDQRGDQGALDFGTTFDCFDPKSATRAPGIPALAAANRLALVKVMQAEGFSNYAREWWHFSFDRLGRATAADFPVTAP